MANAPDIAVVWVTLDNRCVLSGDGVNYFVTLSQGGKVFDRRPSPTRATALAIVDTWLEERLQGLPRPSREGLRRHR